MDKGIEQHNESKPEHEKKASGKPGLKPTWASGAKTIVGTAATAASRIWFTVSRGALTELYFPDVDQANTRSVRFLVSDGEGFFSDETHDAEHTVTWLKEGAPGCRIETRCKQGRYTLRKEIITDPIRDTLMMRVRFMPANGDTSLKLYLHAEPHVGDRGENNDAWVGQYKGHSLLVAVRGDLCMGVMCSPEMVRGCCGYAGVSDGLTMLAKGEPLPDANTAMDGNVGLTAEIDTSQDGEFKVSLAFGDDAAEAGLQTRAGVLQDFTKTCDLFLEKWDERQGLYDDIEDQSESTLDMYRVSTAVLETHQSKRFPGAFVASLSLPWGFDRGDKDVGGYHVVWPRDMVEASMGKLASGDARTARSNLFYMSCVQNAEGGWSQNMWLDGTTHWGARQMDGIALPILLADRLRRDNALDGYDSADMGRQAACFLLRHGPVTQQGRWEAIPGYSPYTIATEVAALLAAADCIEASGRDNLAEFLRETADAWNDCIDEFVYVQGTKLAEEQGVQGYYIRMAPPERMERNSIHGLTNNLPNQVFGLHHRLAEEIVSPDALCLVRFGLRAPDDPRILDSLKVVDATLKREMQTGCGWIRSTADGYGEHADGAPFKQHGVGRCWPLLAGERAHYEIAAGNPERALELLKTMARQTSECGMIPEQVWDAEDIPERYLFNGHPTGSGMPLVWAHAEYIKLLRSLKENRVWDMPPQTVERYQQQKKTANFQIWTPQQQRAYLAPGKRLRIDAAEPVSIRVTAGEREFGLETQDTGFRWHAAMLESAEYPEGTRIELEIKPRDKDSDIKPVRAKVEVQKPE